MKITKATLNAWNNKIDRLVEDAMNKGDTYLADLYYNKKVVATAEMAKQLNADKEKRTQFYHNRTPETIVKAHEREKFQSLTRKLQSRLNFSSSQIAKLRRAGARNTLSKNILKNRNIQKSIYGSSPVEDNEEEIDEISQLLGEELGVLEDFGADIGSWED